MSKTHKLDVHLNVRNILDELAPRALNGHRPRLDLDRNVLGHNDRFDGGDVLHFWRLDSIAVSITEQFPSELRLTFLEVTSVHLAPTRTLVDAVDFSRVKG